MGERKNVWYCSAPRCWASTRQLLGIHAATPAGTGDPCGGVGKPWAYHGRQRPLAILSQTWRKLDLRYHTLDFRLYVKLWSKGLPSDIRFAFDDLASSVAMIVTRRAYVSRETSQPTQRRCRLTASKSKLQAMLYGEFARSYLARSQPRLNL